MKYTAVLAALIATAVAVPTGGGGGNTPPPAPSQCNNNQQSTCCNSVLLGGLLCNLGILSSGGTCSGQSYCCDNHDTNGISLIDLNLLNCVKIL